MSVELQSIFYRCRRVDYKFVKFNGLVHVNLSKGSNRGYRGVFASYYGSGPSAAGHTDRVFHKFDRFEVPAATKGSCTPPHVVRARVHDDDERRCLCVCVCERTI